MALGDEGGIDTDEDRVELVDVWSCNMLSVQVFQRCTISGIGAGMGGVWWTGIHADEIRIVCELLNVPRDRVAEIAWDVRFMGTCVADARNKRAEKAAKAHRANA